MNSGLFERFVQCVCKRQQFDLKLEQARADLSEFREDGLIIAEGEKTLIDDLSTLLKDVESRFVVLRSALEQAKDAVAPPMAQQTTPEQKLEATLGEIEAILNNTKWELLDPISQEITRKRRVQTEFINASTERLRKIDEKLKEIRPLLAEANRYNAGTTREQNDVARINRRYEQAYSSVTGRRAVAYGAMDSIEDEIKPMDTLLDVVRQKATEAKKIYRRSDLLLLRSPPDARDLLHYDALLRTASEPGVHGISLHATSIIVRQDREELTDRMEQITKLIRAGRLRDASLKNANYESSAGAGEIPASTRADTAETTPSMRQFGGLRDPSVVPTAGGDSLLKETGQFLYKLLLPEPVQRYLESANCSLSLTTNDLELPWELMHDGTEHLCIQRPIARMPMGSYLPRERRIPTYDEKIFFLVVRPSEDLPGAAQEVETIKKALLALERNVQIDELGPKDATNRELNIRLSSGKYRVIHFAGHARFDVKDPDLSGLLLANGETFLAQKAQRFLEGRPLVFLNACESGAAPADLTPEKQIGMRYLQTPAAGLASAFVYGGALGCVGAVWPVYDDGAAFLATELYKELLDGTMIGEAMRRARERTRKQFSKQVTWASFVLYGDPTFQLLQAF